MRLRASSRRRTAQPEEETTLHKGNLYNAVPDHRNLYVSTLILRVLSLIISAFTMGTVFVLRDNMYNNWNSYRTWTYGAPPTGIALVWDLVDLAGILIHDRGFLTAKKREAQRKKSTLPATSFCWGRPAIHVTAHMTIWVVTLIMCILLWGQSFGYTSNITRLNIVPSLQIFLVAIHFILFVLACVATDDKLREYSDVIFISKDQGEEDEVTTLPSSLWETWRPKKLPMAVAVNQYVRFVPGEDGTVRVAGDFGSAAS